MSSRTTFEQIALPHLDAAHNLVLAGAQSARRGRHRPGGVCAVGICDLPATSTLAAGDRATWVPLDVGARANMAIDEVAPRAARPVGRPGSHLRSLAEALLTVLGARAVSRRWRHCRPAEVPCCASSRSLITKLPMSSGAVGTVMSRLSRTQNCERGSASDQKARCSDEARAGSAPASTAKCRRRAPATCASTWLRRRVPAFRPIPPAEPATQERRARDSAGVLEHACQALPKRRQARRLWLRQAMGSSTHRRRRSLFDRRVRNLDDHPLCRQRGAD